MLLFFTFCLSLGEPRCRLRPVLDTQMCNERPRRYTLTWILMEIELNDQSITFAESAPTNKISARWVILDEPGGERLLGEYTFDHTRTMPDPVAW